MELESGGLNKRRKIEDYKALSELEADGQSGLEGRFACCRKSSEVLFVV